MRIFRSSYKARGSEETILTRRWYIELRDHRNIIRRLKAYNDKSQSEALGRTVLKLVENRTSGDGLTPELSRALERLTDSTKKTLAEWGLIEQSKLTGSKTLAEHIGDWQADLLARGNTKQHAELSAHRVESLAKACGFRFYSDISAAKVQQELAGRRKDTADAKGKLIRGLSIQSTNSYLSCIKSFCRWMTHERRATSSPVEYLDGQNVATDKRHSRRMLNQSDFAKLLTAAQAGPERHGMTGGERALIYELAATTGLRASELASLTAGSFCLGESPSVTIAAKSAKNRTAASLPLRADMAVKLAAFMAKKLPAAVVFARLDKFNAARIIRIDLKAAKIPYSDESGNVFDFHALRHQFISNLAAAGVHPRTAQELARHSDIKLTMNRYTHVLRGELDKAVDLLPDYAAEQARQSAKALKTGTHGKPADKTHGNIKISKSGLALRLALPGEKRRTSANLDELQGAGMIQSQSPVESSESRDLTGDSDDSRRCSSMAEQRFCKP